MGSRYFICCNITGRAWVLVSDALGALAIVLMLFAPSGIWGGISHSLDLSLLRCGGN
jgi:hypothetical protein